MNKTQAEKLRDLRRNSYLKNLNKELGEALKAVQNDFNYGHLTSETCQKVDTALEIYKGGI